MIDMEKVVRGLRIERECVSRDCDRDCGKCDLVQDKKWLLSVYDDALEYLTKAITPIWNQDARMFECTACGYYVRPSHKHCTNCGRELNWQ